jgi:hypothetical protein
MIVYKIEMCVFMHACFSNVLHHVFMISYQSHSFLLFIKVTHVPMQIHFLMAKQVMDFHRRAFVLIYPHYCLMEFSMIQHFLMFH